MSDSNKDRTPASTSSFEEPSLGQRIGAIFLWATLAWSVYVNTSAFFTFLSMLSDMTQGSCTNATAAQLAGSFGLGLIAIPIFLIGVIMNKGTEGGALKWGVIGLVTSVFSALGWYILVMVIAAIM
jgi:PPE-repeat protein